MLFAHLFDNGLILYIFTIVSVIRHINFYFSEEKKENALPGKMMGEIIRNVHPLTCHIPVIPGLMAILAL